jgi:hypothetical protein
VNERGVYKKEIESTLAVGKRKSKQAGMKRTRK